MMHRLLRFSVTRVFAGAAVVLSTLSAAPQTVRAQAASARRAASPGVGLPDSVADFSALVRQLSDVGGYFDTDNLISNERGYQQVLGAIEREGVRGGAYIGVGPDQNFTYIARTRPQIAFLTDIRRDNMLQHLLFKALFARSRNRAEYLALWTGRAVPSNVAQWNDRTVQALVSWVDSAPFDRAAAQQAQRLVREEVLRAGLLLSGPDMETIARFHNAFMAEGLSLRFASTGRAPQPHYPTLRQLILEQDADGEQRGYLTSEADFQFVKSMHRRNLIIPVTGDLGGPRTLTGIGRYLAAHNARVSMLYVSNVEDYLLRDGTFATYLAGVRTLPRDPQAVIVRSYFGGGYGHPESTPQYYATQLVQRLGRFVADTALARPMRYRELVNRDWLPLRK